MKTLCLPIILLLAFWTSQNVYGEAVRGRLDGVGPYGGYPVTGVAVTVFSPAYGRSAPSYSDYQGMFYIYDLNPGPHTLEVWLGGPNPLIFNIFIDNQPMTDIAPIRVR